MKSLERIELEKEKYLQDQRWTFTVELHDRAGPFWQEIDLLRTQWGIRPLVAVPQREWLWHWWHSTFHLPLIPLFFSVPETQSPTGLDALASFARHLTHLADWRSALAGVYKRVILLPNGLKSCITSGGSYRSYATPPRLMGFQPTGDLFADHWAPFISGCALFDPPRHNLTDFANQIKLHRETVERAWQNYLAGQQPCIDLPGIRFKPDADALAQVDRNWDGIVQHWLAITMRDALPSTDLFNLYRQSLEDLSTTLMDLILEVAHDRPEELAQLLAPFQPPPIRAEPDYMSAALNRDTVIAVWQLLRPATSRGGRPALRRLETLQTELLREQGLTESQIAEQLGFPLRKDSYDRKRRSNHVQNRLKREREFRAGRKNPTG